MPLLDNQLARTPLAAQLAENDAKAAHQTAQHERTRHIAEQVRSSKDTTALYWRLFIAAPGIISLSVTFVGYYLSLKTAPALNVHLLGVAWYFLIISMLTSLVRNFLAPVGANYATRALLVKAQADAYNADRKLVQSAPGVIDRHTLEPVTDITEENKETIAYLYEGARRLKRSTGWIELGRDVSEYLAVIMFFAGTITLIYFVYTALKILSSSS